MKNLVIFLMLLFVAVFTTGCINSYAVKQLNDIAIEYLNSGDVQSAIARLEASVDLDANIYESRYNLAVAYLRIGDCAKGLDNIKIAKELKKGEEPAVYYTLGVANNCLADQIYETKDENGVKKEKKYDNKETEKSMAKLYVEYLTEANINYDKYTHLEPNAEDTKAVLDRINQNKEKIETKKALIGE